MRRAAISGSAGGTQQAGGGAVSGVVTLTNCSTCSGVSGPLMTS